MSIYDDTITISPETYLEMVQGDSISLPLQNNVLENDLAALLALDTSQFDPTNHSQSPPSTSIGSHSSEEEFVFSDYTGYSLDTDESIKSFGNLEFGLSPMTQNNKFQPNDQNNNLYSTPTSTPLVHPLLSKTQRDFQQCEPSPRIQVTSLTQTVKVPEEKYQGQYKITVKGVPEKSRVETQIKMCVRLEDKTGATIRTWPAVRLDPILVAPSVVRRKLNSTKQKQQKNLAQSTTNQPSLLLKAEVVGATPPNDNIQRCYGCIQREMRNTERKVKRRKSGTQESPQQASLEEEKARILQFYCEPLIPFSSGEIILPTRITCYCRHHKEPSGFIIRLYLYNQKTLLATGSSPVIMITDDHKSSKKRSRDDQITQEGTKDQKKKNNNTLEKVELPIIQQVIPNEGPITGGIEITVLGSNFKADLRCFFGSNETSKIKFWGESTLVATLPPSLTPGPVLVNLLQSDQIPTLSHNQSNVIFTYINTCDRQLLELALQVIGMKLNGRLDNPAQIAMQIVHENNESYRNSFVNVNPGFGAGNNAIDLNGDKTENNISETIEKALKYVLSLDTEYPLDLSHQNKSGHQMLHLAVILDLSNVIDILLQNKPYLSIDLHDKNGWTALHYAAYFGKENLVRKLLEYGASPNLDNDSHKFPHDLTQNSIIKSLLQEKIISSQNTDHVIYIGEENPPENRNRIPRRKKSEQYMNVLWGMFWGAIVSFWWNYRVFLYIGLLAATGAWTLLDYVPTLMGTEPNNVVVYPKGVSRLNSMCNPPRMGCGSPGEIPIGKPIEVDPGLVPRSFTLSPVQSLESYLLNFGQFALFIASLSLIIFHFKKPLGSFRFCLLVVLIFIAFVGGSLFILDIVWF